MPGPSHPWFSLGGFGAAVGIESGSIEFSMDNISGRAQCQFPGDFSGNAFGKGALFPAVDVNQQVFINGGLGLLTGAHSLFQLFSGWIEEDGSAYSGTSLENTLFMGDQLRLTQYAIGDPAFDLVQTTIDWVAYYQYMFGTDGTPTDGNNGPWTDITLVKDLLTRSGVTSDLSGIGGLGTQMATDAGIVLKNSQTPADLIKQIDDASACQTFATPSGPRRISTTYTPSNAPRWILRESYSPSVIVTADPSTYAILAIDNTRSMKDFFNRALVKGLKLGARGYVSIRQAPANLPAVGGGAPLQLPFGRPSSLPITHTFSSDLIQSQDMADNKSFQMMTMGNRIGRRISVTTDFNPQAEPGQTVAIYAPHAKIYSTSVGFAWGVKHSWDGSGAWTTWDVAIYDGNPGTLQAPPNIALIN